MDGITILNQTVRLYVSDLSLFILFITAVVALAGLITAISTFTDYLDKKEKITVGIIALSIFSISTAAFVFDLNNKNLNWNYNEYKAVIDDSVTFNEVIENYDIKDVDGKLITLCDKDHTVNPNQR